MNRRSFLQSTAAFASLPSLAPFASKLSIKQDQAKTIYRDSIVIDCLASPAAFNIPWPPVGPLSEEQLKNVRECGITAVNLTVSAPEFEKTVRNVAFWTNEVRTHNDAMMLVRDLADFAEAKKSKRLGVILGFQHSEMLGRDLSRIEMFKNLGVRIIQLTYNRRNLLGDGCLEPGNGGLSKLGREAVEQMNAQGLAVDLSHCNTQTTADGIAVSSKPVIISHSGCREVYQNPRNKEDRELRAMTEKGGVIGIFLMPFLGNDGSPYANKEMFFAHLKHALNVCGSDHVGVGSDLSITPVEETPEYLKTWREGGAIRKRLGIQAPDEAGRFPYLPDLNSPRRLELIAIEMEKRGDSAGTIEKVLGKNFLRAFGEIWN
mgnify:CR=1 FL=1